MPDSAVPSELEAKLLVEREGDLDTLARLTRLGTYRLSPQPARNLHSTYFDTKDLALARHGIALRLRRAGDTWEATVKWSGSIRGHLHERPELNVALTEAPGSPFRLPPELYVHLAALLAGRSIAPVLVTEIERLAINVFDADGSCNLAEIALDRVYAHGPRKRDPRSERYCEVEIERKDGTADDVVHITSLICHRRQMRATQDSKFSRGLHLLYGSAALHAQPSNELSFEDSVNSAVHKIVARNLARLRGCDPGTRIGQDAEPLHDMRVATRRLRAVVRALEPAFAPRLHTELTRGLQWLGRLLGAVRDADVQMQFLAAYRKRLHGNQNAALESYATFLQDLRRHARSAMIEGLDSRAYFRLLQRLEAFSGTPAIDAEGESITKAGAAAMRKACKQLRKRGNKIGRHPSAGDLHEVRIRSKRLRYVSEFLRPLTGKPGRRFVKHMVELQDLLGAHNDAVVATSFARRFLDDPASSASAETSAALLNFIRRNEEQAAQARAEFHRSWKHFASHSTQKDFAAILNLLS